MHGHPVGCVPHPLMIKFFLRSSEYPFRLQKA